MNEVRELDGARRSLLERWRRGEFAPGAQTLARRPVGCSVPASPAQQRFWFLDQLQPGTPVHNLAYGIEIRGSLDLEALCRTLNEIVRRHEILRLRFAVEDGLPVQVFVDELDVGASVVDLAGSSLADAKRAAGELTTSMAGQPFDLFEAPLFRVAILRLSSELHSLVFVVHHAIFDGWSLGVFVEEFASLYRSFARGEESSLPDLVVQFGDYAVWQRDAIERDEYATALAYWTEQLRTGTEPLQLPTDYPRPTVQQFHGRTHHFRIPAAVFDSLRRLAVEEQATTFMTCLAAFQVLLHRYSGQSEFSVGSPIANRTRDEIKRLIGPFLNLLVLRADLSGDPTFRALLGRVRRTASGAYAHQELPFQQLVERLAPPRDLSRTPLFQAVIVLQNSPVPELVLDGLGMRPFGVDTGAAHSDVALFLVPDSEGLEGTVEYNAGLFRPETIEKMFDAFVELLAVATDEPDQLISRLCAVVEPNRLEPATRHEALPLSFAQQRLWILDQLLPEPGVLNVCLPVELEGSVDITALDASILGLEERHEALRTTFVTVDGEPRQFVVPPGAVTVQRRDLRSLDGDAQAAALAAAIGAAREERFDMTRGPLVRAELFERSDDRATLLIVLHRIVADAQSRAALIEEIACRYASVTRGVPCELDQPPVQFADYALWERRELSGPRHRALVDYWRDRLADAPLVLELPVRTRRGPGTLAAAECTFELSPVAIGQIDEVIRAEDVTRFTTLLAGLAVLLARYSGQSDLVVGASVTSRTRSELDGIVGNFANAVALRLQLDEELGFRALLRRVDAVVAGAHDHRELPVDQLVESLGLGRGAGRPAAFQVHFALEPDPTRTLVAGDLTVRTRDAVEHALVLDDAMLPDLRVTIRETSDALHGTMTYRSDVFDPECVEGMAVHLEHLLAQLLAAPDRAIAEARTLTPVEHDSALATSGTTDQRDHDACLHKLFEGQAQLRPDAEAVSHDGQRRTYGELDVRANQVAHGLIDAGVGPGDVVALLFDNGAAAVETLLGVLKAGAAFACLDPQHPSERLREALEQLQAALVVVPDNAVALHPDLLQTVDTSGCTVVVLAEPGTRAPEPRGRLTTLSYDEQPTSNPGVLARPGDLAYVAFTSGSTGRPKGIRHTHRNLAQFVQWQSRQFTIRPPERVAQLAALTFDVAYCEIFGALCFGATLCIRPPGAKGDPARLGRWLHDDAITVLQVIPRLFREILHALDLDGGAEPALVHLARLLFVGESLPPDLVSTMRDRFGRALELVNVYGPTESVAATFHVVDDLRPETTSIPIGRAITGRQVLVLDPSGQLCPPHVPGEIWIRSPYLSVGCHGESEPGDRFASGLRAIGPGRAYRTGDRARRRRDGTLEFAGRADNQVKILGIRLELEDVEAAAARHPALRECAALVDEHDGHQRLVIYVVGDPHESLDDLRAFLATRVPAHMIPSEVVRVEALPRTPNGKIDRSALPPPPGRRRDALPYVAPRTPLEEELAQMVKEVLGLDQVGVDDSFFDLGGNSLQAARLVNRVREQYAVEVSLPDLFANPTVAATAAATEQARRDDGYDERLARISAHVAQLPDDEVRALLAERHGLGQDASIGGKGRGGQVGTS